MQDQIGSTRVVTNDSGTVVYAEAHDPYGGIQKTWVNTFDPKRKFSDKERDGETGLDYFGARYYSRYHYRWLSIDSVLDVDRAMANAQSWNLYSFCENDPVTYSDPNGRSIVPSVYLFPLNGLLSALNRAQLSLSNLLKGIHIDIAGTEYLDETNFKGGLTYTFHNFNYKITKKGNKWVIKIDFRAVSS